MFVLKYRVMETPEGDDMGVLAQAADPAGLESILRRMDEFAPIPLADGRRRAPLRSASRRGGGTSTPTDSAPSASRRGPAWSSTSRPWTTPSVRPAFVGKSTGRDVTGASPATHRRSSFAAAADDPLFDGSVAAHAAWRAAGRPVEAHLYGRGGHGFGMVTQGTPSDRWIDQFHSWITTDVEAPGAPSWFDVMVDVNDQPR